MGHVRERHKDIGPNHIDKVKFYARKRGNISGKVQSLDLAGII